MDGKNCCTPHRSNAPPTGLRTSNSKIASSANADIPVVQIPSGNALIGTQFPFITDDGESPIRRRKINKYLMTQTSITNAMFAAFVEDTGYVTEAEDFGWSFVFHSNIPASIKDTQSVPGTQWWRRVDLADWKMINGPGSENDWHADHPVVHVSWKDANEFANWAGGRLPTELEWEHAARGGLGDVLFPWGNKEPDDQTYFPCNIWQGKFPNQNDGTDGFIATAPARSYSPNGYGLYNMCGNVWEWTSETYKVRSLSKSAKIHASKMKGRKLLKGGSFLCHKSYCFRYRIAARTGNTPDSTTTHQGFRLVFDDLT